MHHVRIEHTAWRSEHIDGLTVAANNALDVEGESGEADMPDVDGADEGPRTGRPHCTSSSREVT